MKLKPLTHQVSILKELKEKNKALVHIPSGAGKTHTIAFDVLQKKPKSMLYIVHRNEILLQTVAIFKEVCNISDNDIGILNEYHKDFSKKYLFATNMTLGRIKNLEKMRKDIEYIIIDEFHHAAASTYKRIIEYFQPKYLYGLTATPERSDLRDIKSIIENNVVGNMDIFTGIEQGVLVSFDYRGYWDNVDYSDIEHDGYRYKQNDLDKKLLIDERDKAIIKKYKELVEPENRLTLGFCASVKHVKRMSEKFREAGIWAAGITYLESLEERKQILHGFRNGTYKVLFTRDILNEGVDFPECEALLFLRPTMSKIVFLQQLGRGLRIRKGKKNVLVLDFIGNSHRAFKIREYLRELTEPKYTGARYKPEYKHNVPTVHFDEKVLKMFDIQAAAYNKNEYVSKEELLEYFKTALPDEPPFPHIRSIKNENGYKYSCGSIQNKFGGYYNMLLELGKIDGTMSTPPYYSRRHFVETYKKIKELTNGQIPTTKDIAYLSNKNKLPIRRGSITSAFGTTNKFIQEMGDTPRYKYKGKRANPLTRWTKELMIKTYKEEKERLGGDAAEYIPTLKHLDNLHVGFDKALWKLFDNKYYEFLKLVENKDGITKHCQICNKEIKVLFSNNNFRKIKWCSKACMMKAIRETAKRFAMNKRRRQLLN